MTENLWKMTDRKTKPPIVMDELPLIQVVARASARAMVRALGARQAGCQSLPPDEPLRMAHNRMPSPRTSASQPCPTAFPY
ncbi:hypothetical protein ACYX7E_14260 [Luteimonas sp. RIT-PG2_3]